jgi:hypothetical protein
MVAGRIAGFRYSGLHKAPGIFVIRGQVMAQFVIRGQDMLKSLGGSDCSDAENKALAVASLCFNWPN